MLAFPYQHKGRNIQEMIFYFGGCTGDYSNTSAIQKYDGLSSASTVSYLNTPEFETTAGGIGTNAYVFSVTTKQPAIFAGKLVTEHYRSKIEKIDAVNMTHSAIGVESSAKRCRGVSSSMNSKIYTFGGDGAYNSFDNNIDAPSGFNGASHLESRYRTYDDFDVKGTVERTAGAIYATEDSNGNYIYSAPRSDDSRTGLTFAQAGINYPNNSKSTIIGYYVDDSSPNFNINNFWVTKDPNYPNLPVILKSQMKSSQFEDGRFVYQLTSSFVTNGETNEFVLDGGCRITKSIDVYYQRTNDGFRGPYTSVTTTKWVKNSQWEIVSGSETTTNTILADRAATFVNEVLPISVDTEFKEFLDNHWYTGTIDSAYLGSAGVVNQVIKVGTEILPTYPMPKPNIVGQFLLMPGWRSISGRSSYEEFSESSISVTSAKSSGSFDLAHDKCAVAYNNIVYLIGGADLSLFPVLSGQWYPSGYDSSFPTNFQYVNKVDTSGQGYSSNIGTFNGTSFASGKTMLYQLSRAVAGELNGNIYIFGGRNRTSSAVNSQKYVPLTQTIGVYSAASSSYIDRTCEKMSGLLYLSGGTASGGAFSGAISKFDEISTSATGHGSLSAGGKSSAHVSK